MTIINAFLKKNAGPEAKMALVPTDPAETQRIKTDKHGEKKGQNGCCILWFIMFGAVILVFGVAVAILMHIYTPDWRQFNDGDQVKLSRVWTKLDSVVCEAYSFSAEPKSSVASFFLNYGPDTPTSVQPKWPPADMTYNLSNFMILDGDAFYLLPGSYIDINNCIHFLNPNPNIRLEILIFKGYDNFNAWVKDASCPHCVSLRVPFRQQNKCEYMPIENPTLYSIYEADTYIVYFSTEKLDYEDIVPFKALVFLTLWRNLYEVDKDWAKESCVNSEQCELSLTYGAHDAVIVQFPFSQEIPNPSYVVTCKFRRLFFVVVFVIVPASIVAMFSIVLYCVHKFRTWKETETASRKRHNIYTILQPDTELPSKEPPHTSLPPLV